MGEEVSAIIAKQRILEKRFEDIISQYKEHGDDDIETYKTVILNDGADLFHMSAFFWMGARTPRVNRM